MAKTTIKGNVISKSEKSGTSAKGEWTNTTLVVETADKYNNTVPISFMNKAVTANEGDQVEVEAYIGGREWQGKYYAQIDGDTVNVVSSTPSSQQEPQMATAGGNEEDDLPF